MADMVEAKGRTGGKVRRTALPTSVGVTAAPETVSELATAGQVVVEQLPPSPAQLAETIEAVTSPAQVSDASNAPEFVSNDPALAREELDMATVAPAADATDKAQAAFTDYTSRFKSAFEKSSKLGEEFVELAKGNVEALIASARVAAKAGETFGQEAAEYGKRNLESATTAFKSFASVKSPTELFQLQSEFAKASFDNAVAEASRVSESLLKVAGDIAQPLSNRYAIAAEKIKSASL